MLHQDGPGNSAAKDSVSIPQQIIEHAHSFPAHGRMARFDGFCLGPTEESHAHGQ